MDALGGRPVYNSLPCLISPLIPSPLQDSGSCVDQTTKGKREGRKGGKKETDVQSFALLLCSLSRPSLYAEREKVNDGKETEGRIN